MDYHCARAIAAASPEWHVVIGSRDRAKSLEAARAIAASGNPNVTAIDLVLDAQLESVSGKYFAGRNQVPSPKQSYDESQLWDASARMVHLRPEERMLPKRRGVRPIHVLFFAAKPVGSPS